MHSTRISTGIAGLDVLFQGGYLKNRSYLLAGEAGTGKTIACIQFLLTGLRQGEKGVYVTVDERPAEILHSATSLEWDLQTHIQEKSLVILDASSYFSGRAGGGPEKGGDLEKFVSDLAGYAKRIEATRLVIDPVTPLIVATESPARVQELARALVHLLQSQLSTTNLLTSHLPSQSDHDLTHRIEEFLAAGVLVLRVSRVEDRLIRLLSVKKMRGTAVEPSEYPFRIVKKSGIALTSPQPSTAQSDPFFHPLECFEPAKEEPGDASSGS
jgi:circadian clock protein KaiC